MKEYLTQCEVDKLLGAAALTNNPIRDKAIVLLSVRHGLRKSELVKLRWDDITFGKDANIYIRRAKGSKSGTHPLAGDEQRLLRKLKEITDSDYVFITYHGTPMASKSVDNVLNTLSKLAGMERVNPHALRHTCGYLLINKGIELRIIQDYLGHRNIQNTVRYTALDHKQFNNLWE